MAVKPKATPKAAVSTGNALIQRAKVNLPANIQEAMSADVAAFQERMGAATGNRIAVTQDRKFRDPQGEKHDSLQGIIIDFIAKKAWYEGEYDKDNIVPPNCFALGFEPHDQLVASPNSPDLQLAEGCKTCPKNAFKSARNGKGKACKDAYVIAMIPPMLDTETAEEYQARAQLMTLEISATGLKPFEKYVRDLARDYGKAPYAFVTEFFMDETVDYSSVRAGNPEGITAIEAQVVFASRDEAAKLLSVEPNVAEFDEKVGSKKTALAVPKARAAGKPAGKR